MELPMAQKADVLLKNKITRACRSASIWFQQDLKDGIRYLTELRLWECSFVTFPMNELAGITSIKQNEPDD